jgi:hypothetical protein
MKSVFPSILSAVLAAGLFSSCANQKFSKAQLDSMSSVAITADTSGDAPKRLFAGSDGPAATGIVVGAVAGAGVGGALGAVIGDQISKSQDESFHQKNPAAAASITKITPRDMGPRLQKRLTSTLQRDPFFGPRLKSSGSTVLHARMDSYQLRRSGERGGEFLFSPFLSGTATLKDSGGKELTKVPFRISAKTKRTLSEYNSNPKLLESDYDEVLNQAATTIGQTLSTQAGQR